MAPKYVSMGSLDHARPSKLPTETIYPTNVAELLMVEKQIMKKISESTNWYIVAQYKEIVNAMDFLSV